MYKYFVTLEMSDLKTKISLMHPFSIKALISFINKNNKNKTDPKLWTVLYVVTVAI